MKKIFFLILILILTSQLLGQVRIKDIAHYENGAYDIQVIGYGLVVGLPGTGDRYRTIMAQQSLKNMLEHFGLAVDDPRLWTKNIAAVMVTATIPSHARIGGKIDISVSSLGDARSLENGVLLMTPLISPDGKTWAQAQGHIVVSNENTSSGSYRIYRANTGIISDGAILERNNISYFPTADTILLQLNYPDYTTASRIAIAINEYLSSSQAKALDAGGVSIIIPEEYKNDSLASFIASIETLTVIPDNVSKVVINKLSGTIVVGGDIRIASVMVTQGEITLQVNSNESDSLNSILESTSGRTFLLDNIPTVSALATIFQQLKLTPNEIISLFQALKRSGALQAELEIM